MTEQTEELPTNPHGSDPPDPINLLEELRSMFTSLLSSVGKLRTDIVNHTAVAAQVSERLHLFNTNIDALRHEVQNLAARQSIYEKDTSERFALIDGRLARIEGSK